MASDFRASTNTVAFQSLQKTLLENSFLPLFPCRRQRIRTGVQPLASRPCVADLRHVELHDRPSVPLHDARVTWRSCSSPVSPSYQAIILYSVGPCPYLTWCCRLRSTSGRICTFIFRTHATGSIIQSVIHSLLDLRYTTSVPPSSWTTQHCRLGDLYGQTPSFGTCA